MAEIPVKCLAEKRTMGNSVQSKTQTVCVVIVTYNRKELLWSLLLDLRRQTYGIDAIVLFDNNSTDGTYELLQQRGIIEEGIVDSVTVNMWEGISFYYYRSSVNRGGSGGFEKAFSIAEQLNYDYIWVMDDDVSPEKECLKSLLSRIDETAKVCIPSRMDSNWDDYAVTNYNLTNPFLIHIGLKKSKIHSNAIKDDYINVVDMPFEGPLISMEIARKVGLPNSEYFIMYDDTDYAYRLSKETNIRYVVDAKLHRKLASKNAKENEWNWKKYYILRNEFWFDSLYGKNIFVRKMRPLLCAISRSFSALIKGERYKRKIVVIAYHDYLKKKMGKQLEPGTPVDRI